MFVRTLILAIMILLQLACESKSGQSNAAQTSSAVKSEQFGLEASAAPTSYQYQTRSLLEDMRYCEVRHRGIVIDPGSDWSDSHRSFHMADFDDVEHTNRAGSSSGRVRTRKLVYDFWLDQAAKGVLVSFRAEGEAARNVVLFVDGRRVGAARINSGDSKVFKFGPVDTELAAGRHTLTWRFTGGSRSSGAAVALLDWVRVYLPDNGPDAYLPAVKSNLIQDVVLGDQPRQGLALRSPGSVRCAVLAFEGARVKVDVGYWGVGAGVAQVRVVTPDGRRVVLAERKVEAEESAEWLPLDLALDAFAGQLVGVEFAALEASSSGRVVFGEPALARRVQVRPPVTARNVVMVVAGGLSRKLIPPWGDRQGKGTLFDLADHGVVFESYRANSTLVTSVMATLLSGAPPGRHMIGDPAARVPAKIQLISEVLRKGGGRSAFFTNVPYSFPAFGFERGWHEFASLSPVEDRPASEPFTLAKRWLLAEVEEAPERKRLLVLHLRGGHPPWDLSADEVKALPPDDYGGILEARRGATVLREIRTRHSQSRRRLGPRDQIRLEAMQDAALRKQDEGFGALVQALEDSGQLEQTLFVFAGDVAMGDPPSVPFAPLGKLEAGRLMPPLIVRFPGNVRARERSTALVTPEHVARTLFEALELEPPEYARGPSLSGALNHGVGLTDYGLLATQGHRYAHYVGRWRLRGSLGETPGLCNFEVDPACQTDVYSTNPLIAHWMWRSALRAFEDERGQPPAKREAADIDDATRAALSVYGL